MRFLSTCLLGVVALVVGASCGGKTEDGAGSAGGSGAGGGTTGGAGGSTAGGGGGSQAGQGGAASCSTNADCALVPSKCCACGQTESDFRAVRKAEQVASQPKCEAVDCAPCAAPPKAFAAACDAGACKVVSIGDSPLDACGADTDCTLHAQGCCECGSPGQIALAKSQVAAYEGSVCLPNATCPGCLPLFPPAAARCAGGHCKVEPLACPPSAPAPGSPCSLPSGVDECEFGADPVLACRSKGKCVGGAWQVTDYDCAPLPGPGVAGCLTSASQAGQTCSNEGTFCQVGAAICACDACSFGPCSMTAHWVCSTAQAGCPSTPPPKGGACQGVQACEYGPCGSKTGARRVCKDGVWKDEPQACPV